MIQWIMLCVITPSYTICINREKHGFFKGGRGLRQEDPLSPYLFTIVMEVFNLILQQEIKVNRSYKYHHGCKELEITHLCFVDDLLVLCHGYVAPVSVIKNTLDKFSYVSGLYPNLGKSTIFCGSLDKVTIDAIFQIMPFKKGKLLIRYSGVPLVPKKIKVKDCKGLNDKVKARNGGLGLKSLESWNNALLIKHLWNVANKKDSLWVKWVSIVKLKGRGVWDMENRIMTTGYGRIYLTLDAKQALDSIVSRRDIYSAGFANDEIVSRGVKQCSNNAQEKDLKDLDSCKNQFSKMPCTNNIWSIVRRLTLASTIYFIWKERNLRTFQQKCRSPEVLFQAIIDSVKCRLLSLKVKNSKAVRCRLSNLGLKGGWKCSQEYRVLVLKRNDAVAFEKLCVLRDLS
ncbi:RNA-directed DNA polymerase, eukaryota, reverse transcriptase zinc-binding domain protein, partial [Tanacetum coccineum]